MRKCTILVVIVLLAQVLAGATWYKENLAYGLRDSTFLFLSFSESDPQTMYLSTIDGFVFSTHNGGLAWSEARIVVKSQAFFGKIRCWPGASVPLGMSDALKGLQGNFGYGGFDLTKQFAFDYDGQAGNVDFLETGIDSMAYDKANPPMFINSSGFKVQDSAGSRGQGDTAKLGVALGGGAPRLKGMLRGRGVSVGMNLQQLLVMMGVEPTWVNHIGVHPADPNIAIAATSMGTYKTTDGGIGWIPVFGGTDRWERDGQHARFDPIDHNRIYLGTQKGLFISSTGGDRWERVSGTQLEGAYVKWVEPVLTPDGEVWVFAGTAIGGFLSKDAGETWRWIFFETLPETNFVTSIAVDKNDPNHIFFSTRDGVFVTFDCGEKWDRTGGLLFTSTFVPRIVVDPTDGAHAIAATEMNVWETYDNGKTWQVLYIDNGDWWVRNIALDPHEDGVIWIVTSSEILRLTPYRKATTQTGREGMFQAIVRKEPTEYQIMDAMFRNLYIHPGVQTKYRRKATGSFLTPEVSIVGGYFNMRSAGSIGVHPYTNLIYGAPMIERGMEYQGGYVALMAWWDLTGLFFDFDELNFGRIFGAIIGSMYHSKFEIARYYNERVRLLYKLVVNPPEEYQSHVDAAMRYRELTEHLDALTGGLYADHLAEVRKGGIPWLEGLLF